MPRAAIESANKKEEKIQGCVLVNPPDADEDQAFFSHLMLFAIKFCGFRNH